MDAVETARAEISLPTLDDIVKQYQDAQYYLDITIPASLKQNKEIGHTLLICAYPRLREHFLNLIEKRIQPRQLRRTGLTRTKKSMAELAADFTNLNEFDVCLQNAKNLPTDPAAEEQVKTSLSSFYINVVIGKGVGANTVRLDLPEFTLLAVADDISEMPKKYLRLFGNVINFNALEKQDLCMLEANETAKQLRLSFEPAAIAFIATAAQGSLRLAASYVRRIGDYLLVRDAGEQVITEATVRDILSRLA